MQYFQHVHQAPDADELLGWVHFRRAGELSLIPHLRHRIELESHSEAGVTACAKPPQGTALTYDGAAQVLLYRRVRQKLN